MTKSCGCCLCCFNRSRLSTITVAPPFVVVVLVSSAEAGQSIGDCPGRKGVCVVVEFVVDRLLLVVIALS